MAQSRGGTTTKSHKSRKTDPVSAPADGTSSVSLAILPAGPPLPVPTPDQFSTVGSTLAAPTTEERHGPNVATGVPEPEPEPRQWWYRPHDSKARKLVEKIVVLDVAGWKNADIAKKLHTTPATISQYRYIGKKNGWMRIDESGEPEIVDIEAELAMNVDRKIVRNIDASLDGHMTNWQTHEMTMAAAKGRGIFKDAAAKAALSIGELPIVAIQVIMPTIGVLDQRIDETNVGGVPAYAEAEIVEEGAKS